MFESLIADRKKATRAHDSFIVSQQLKGQLVARNWWPAVQIVLVVPGLTTDLVTTLVDVGSHEAQPEVIGDSPFHLVLRKAIMRIDCRTIASVGGSNLFIQAIFRPHVRLVVLLGLLTTFLSMGGTLRDARITLICFFATVLAGRLIAYAVALRLAAKVVAKSVRSIDES